MALTIRAKRGTRSQIDAAATSEWLVQGELYLITDEDKFAVGTSTSTYQVYAKDFGTISGLVKADGSGNLSAAIPGLDFVKMGTLMDLFMLPTWLPETEYTVGQGVLIHTTVAGELEPTNIVLSVYATCKTTHESSANFMLDLANWEMAFYLRDYNLSLGTLRGYTEQNIITDDQSVTASLDALDMAIGDIENVVPSADEKAALAGTGTPSALNKYVTEDDLPDEYTLPVASSSRGGVKAATKGAGDTVEAKIDSTTEKLYVPTYPTVPTKAAGSDINTGTDDDKFVTAKAIEDSDIGKSVIGINAQTGTTYTLALADAGKLVRCSNESAITVTVPKNSVVEFPVNTVITIEQQGAGQITLAPVDGDVTLNKADGLKTAKQYAGLSLIKVDTNVWTVFGGIA